MKKWLSTVFVLICFFTMGAGSVDAAAFNDRVNGMSKLENVRISGEGTKRVRIVFDTTKKSEFKTMELSNPKRIVVDLQDTWMGTNINRQISLPGKVVRKIRISQYNTKTVRVVIDTDVNNDSYQVFALGADKAANKEPRLIMDFGDLSGVKRSSAKETVVKQTDTKPADKKEPIKAEEKPVKKPAQTNQLPDASEAVPKKIEYFHTAGIKGKTISIDPGHGGSDSGAVGPTNVTEKELTLNIARKLQALLEDAGAKVVMTRRTDVDVAFANASGVEELQARADVANNAGADIFISIHMDSFVNKQAKGTTTYYYPKTTGDERLARLIRQSLIGQLGTSDRGTRTCNFYVVKHTKMPATLIEAAFVSNPTEEQLLKSDAGAQKAAEGIFKGIERYFSYDK